MTYDAAAREREIDRKRRELVGAWPEGWERMTRAWAADGGDAVWLSYSANYLLRTAGVRWAIDPATLRNLVPEAAAVSVEALAGLRFIVLTHGHSDHVDRALLKAIAAMPDVRWVVPAFMLKVAEQCGAPASRVDVVEPGRTLTFDGLRLTITQGLHWEYPGRWGEGEPAAGIDAIGLLAEWEDRRALFPGDTRTYDPAALPAMGPVDTLFAHVWLGRGGALEAEPPLLGPFCDFVAALSPTERVLLTHLHQVSREATDYWDLSHAGQARDALAPRLAGARVAIPAMWEEVTL